MKTKKIESMTNSDGGSSVDEAGLVSLAFERMSDQVMALIGKNSKSFEVARDDQGSKPCQEQVPSKHEP